MPFYFFFGLLGLVIGGLLTWFFLADHPFESLETPGGPVDPVEASVLVTEMAASGLPIDEATVTRLLELHGDYVEGRIREAREAAEATRLANDADALQATAAQTSTADRKTLEAEQTKQLPREEESPSQSPLLRGAPAGPRPRSPRGSRRPPEPGA